MSNENPSFQKIISTNRKSWLLLAMELTLLITVVLIYSSPLLNFNTQLLAPGSELQTHTTSIELLTEWLHGRSDFPLWNPVFGTGRPWLADPFLFAFNPFFSLPFILLGAINGAKVAYIINFLIAAFGGWALAKFLELNAPARLWTGLTYALSGAIVGFYTAGEPQLAFGLGWLPWAILSVFWVLKSRSITSVVITAVIQGLFYLTGNLYYQVYSLGAILAIVVIYFIFQKMMDNLRTLTRLLAVGVLTFGFIAFSFVPLVSAQNNILYEGGYDLHDTTFVGSQPPVYGVLNYFLADPAYYNSDLFGRIPFLQESYRYIGFFPLICLLWLIPAYQKGKKCEIIGIAAAFLILLAWSGIQFTFFKYLYQWIPILRQFRFPGRALGAGALFLILLAGFCIDRVWKDVDQGRRELFSFHVNNRLLIEIQSGWIINLLLLGILAGTLYSLYKQNKTFVAWDRENTTIQAGESLKAIDTQQTPLIQFTSAMLMDQLDHIYQDRFHVSQLSDGWKLLDAPNILGDRDAVQLTPKYWGEWYFETFGIDNPILVRKAGDFELWMDPNALPYAFTVDRSSLFDQRPVTSVAEVRQVAQVTRKWPNQVTVQVDLPSPQILIVTETWFPDWRVTIDGHPAALESVSNFLAASVNQGQHTVRFDFNPWSAKVGVILSSLTLVGMILAVIYEGFYLPRSRKKTQKDKLKSASNGDLLVH